MCVCVCVCSSARRGADVTFVYKFFKISILFPRDSLLLSSFSLPCSFARRTEKQVGNVIFEGGGVDVETGFHMLEALALVRAERDSREAGD